MRTNNTFWTNNIPTPRAVGVCIIRNTLSYAQRFCGILSPFSLLFHPHFSERRFLRAARLPPHTYFVAVPFPRTAPTTARVIFYRNVSRTHLRNKIWCRMFITFFLWRFLVYIIKLCACIHSVRRTLQKHTSTAVAYYCDDTAIKINYTYVQQYWILKSPRTIWWRKFNRWQLIEKKKSNPRSHWS